MRPDMHKVIIDLPRGGSFRRNRKTRLSLRGTQVNSWSEEDREDYDSGPRKHSMAMRNRFEPYEDKSSSDRLNPLRRFLRSRVGRLWDAVHSEIAATLDSRSLVRGSHFWTHVFNEVQTGCTLEKDGKIYNYRWGSWSEVTGFYVDPATGILCYRPRETYRLEPKYRFMDVLSRFGFREFDDRSIRGSERWRNFRIVSKFEVLEKMPGGWFSHRFALHKPEDIVGWTKPDPATHQSFPIRFKDVKNARALYRVSTQQLGKKELKRHKNLITGNPERIAGFSISRKPRMERASWLSSSPRNAGMNAVSWYP